VDVTGPTHTHAWGVKQPDSNTYLIKTGKDTIIDQSDPQKGSVSRYANSCTKDTQKAGHCKENNVRAVNKNQNVMLVNKKKTLPKGSEVFWNYGEGYWGKENVAFYREKRKKNRQKRVRSGKDEKEPDEVDDYRKRDKGDNVGKIDKRCITISQRKKKAKENYPNTMKSKRRRK